MVLLVTSDNEQFTTERDVVERSVLIKNMLEGELTASHIATPLTLSRHQMSVNQTSQSLFPMYPRLS